MTSPAFAKIAFVQGYLSSNIETLHAFSEFFKKRGDPNGKGYDSVSALLYYEQNVGDIVKLLDNFYSDQSNRHYWVWASIPYLCGKALGE